MPLSTDVTPTAQGLQPRQGAFEHGVREEGTCPRVHGCSSCHLPFFLYNSSLYLQPLLATNMSQAACRKKRPQSLSLGGFFYLTTADIRGRTVLCGGANTSLLCLGGVSSIPTPTPQPPPPPPSRPSPGTASWFPRAKAAPRVGTIAMGIFRALAGGQWGFLTYTCPEKHRREQTSRIKAN